MIINSSDHVYGLPVGGVSLTWKYRDYLSATIKKLTDAADEKPDGVTYNLTIHRANNSVLRTVSDLTEEAYSYSAADEIADAGSLQATLKFEIETVLNGQVSLNKATVVLNR